jgi:hypothetical protein
MSNSLAIAGVTATLRNLLTRGLTQVPSADPQLADTSVTTLAPDRARGNLTINQLNLFLYQTSINAAYRNLDMPRKVRPGENGQPPLALNLTYLVTAYGRDNDELMAHRLMGRAMRILYDHPLLGAEEIQASLAGTDLHEQIERVRVNLVSQSLEEISKLWSALQTQYRLSVVYEVDVVLIESTRPSATPLPVLTRGRDDTGPIVVPGLEPPYPTLHEALPPNSQAGVRLGEVLTLTGHHLDGTTVQIRFTHPRLAAPLALDPLAGATATQLRAQLPAAGTPEASQWLAGIYTASVVVSRTGEQTRVSNSIPFALAPRMTASVSGTAPLVTFTITVDPPVVPGQAPMLLVGSRAVAAQPFSAATNTLTFVLTDAVPGDHWLRLRVDGVDSELIDRSGERPVFDPTQRVTVS